MAVADNLNIDAAEPATQTGDRVAIAAESTWLRIAGNVPCGLDLILSARGGTSRGACP